MILQSQRTKNIICFTSWTPAVKATKTLYKWLIHFRSNTQNTTKPLLGFQFLSYLFITQCACSLGLCFRKKDVLVRSILPFLMPAWSWNAAIPGSVRVNKDQRSTMFYYLPYAGLSLTWHWNCPLHLTSKSLEWLRQLKLSERQVHELPARSNRQWNELNKSWRALWGWS